MNGKHEENARIFCEAIKTISEKNENLENLENYLSNHFPGWLARFANTPEAMASELKEFAEMEI
jgi:hypothetical protein